MKSGLAALVLIALPLASQADTLDIKTGAWEITESTAMSGMPIPKEAMAGMSLAQRAKMEASMRAQAGKKHVDMSGRWLSATCTKGVDD